MTLLHYDILRKYYGGLMMLPLFLYFLFIYPFSFNYVTSNIKGYYLALPFCIMAWIMAVHFFRKNKTYTIIEILSSGLLVITILLASFSVHYTLFNEHFFMLATVLAIYLLARRTGAVQMAPLLFAAFCIAYVFELAIGFYQFLQYGQRPGLDLSIEGTLTNSGIFSCYLVVGLPILFYMVNRHTRSFALQIVILGLVLAAVIFLLTQTRSRTAILVLCIMLPYTIHYIYPGITIRFTGFLKGHKKKMVLLIMAIGLIMLMLALYDIKKLSAIGRLMSWHITWLHLTDHVWWGTGCGRFTWYYPQWQIDYFVMHPHPPNAFFLSAGETFLAFNEPLQFLAEFGIIGSAAFVWLLYDFFRSTSSRRPQLLNCLKLTVATILLCGCTSYSLHVNYFLLLLTLSLAICHDIRARHSFADKSFSLSNYSILTGCTMLVVTVFITITTVQQVKAIYQWDRISVNNHYTWKQKEEVYAGLYPRLKGSGKFLFSYGELLLQNPGGYQKAIAILLESRQYLISGQTYAAIAGAYKLAGDDQKALAWYRQLSQYIPNRFFPRYEMAKLFQKQGAINKATEMARKILVMPVKRASPEVEQIQREMKQLLIKNSIED